MSTSPKNNLQFINNSASQLSVRNYDIDKKINPQSSARSKESRSYGGSAFLTDFDKMQRTKALWRQSKNVEKFISNSPRSINSLVDLNKMKIKYRMELLKRKSKQQIFQENMEMIQKIQYTPPKVDAWNYYKPKRSNKSSLQKLQLSEKNMQLIKKLQSIQPKVQNWNYRKSKKSLKQLQRTNQMFRILNQNMKMIQRVESVPPKVQAWSYKKIKRDGRLEFQRQLRIQKILEQNMKMIQKVQSIPPKVESWTNIKSLKNKVERKKILHSNQKRLDSMKRMIQQAEKRIYQKNDHRIIQSNSSRRYKTLPCKTPGKIIKRSQERLKNNKRLTTRIQKTKCAIDCWSKPLTMRPKVQKPGQIKNKDKNFGILSSIKQKQQSKILQITKKG